MQDLPWMCGNYKTGCQEIKTNVEDLEHHQRKCIYRKVFCPAFESCQINKILFKDVNEHLETSHKGEIFDCGKKNIESLVLYTAENGMKNGSNWMPTKLTSACGAVFFIGAQCSKDSMCLWVTLMGSSDEAENYSSSISIENKIGKKFNKFNFTGTVHNIDEKVDDIIASGSLLSIGFNTANRLLLTEKKDFRYEITIRNLKEEAKDDDNESGISDGE